MALKEAFDKAKSGSGQVVGIVGEAGVGKSRLLLELRTILPPGAYTYLEGRCLHYRRFHALSAHPRSAQAATSRSRKGTGNSPSGRA